MRMRLLFDTAIVTIVVVGLWTARSRSMAEIADIQTSTDKQPTSGASNDKASIVALKFHADWCSSCRRMGTVFEDLATVAEDEPVLFSRLDLSDRSTRKQARYLMTMLRLEEVWNQGGAGKKTGFILLVDASTGKVLGKLTDDDDLKQMKAALLLVVAKSRG